MDGTRLTIKLINSDTHSWTHSLASLLTFAEPGSEFFMILATFAICNQLLLHLSVSSLLSSHNRWEGMDVQVKTYLVLYIPRPELLWNSKILQGHLEILSNPLGGLGGVGGQKWMWMLRRMHWCCWCWPSRRMPFSRRYLGVYSGMDWKTGDFALGLFGWWRYGLAVHVLIWYRCTTWTWEW